MSKQGSSKSSILERSLGSKKQDVNIATFALLYSTMVQYSQNRVNTVSELQEKLADFGRFVGSKMFDLIAFREKGYKRETKLTNILLFIKGPMWKHLFGKEADNLEQSTEDLYTYVIFEKEPLVNTFISVPKDKGSLNCAAFNAGIVEAALRGASFPAKVTAHWQNGTTIYIVKFNESVIQRETRGDK